MENNLKQSFKKTLQENIELSVFNCGVQVCSPHYTWGPGARDHYLLHYIVSGKGKFFVNNNVYTLSEGDIFFATPAQIITYTADDTEPWKYCWVGFNGSCATKLVNELPFTAEKPIHHCKDAEKIKNAIYKIFINSGNEYRNEVAMVGQLYILLAKLMSETDNKSQNAYTPSSQYVFNAIKYIQSNYFNDISIDDIAKSVGISRSHLYRVFMTISGHSPIDYLTEYRIDQACHLLKNSSLNIAEIAVSVGFFDQFYFSRVFKKHKGMPPSKYAIS
ncbi:MAG: AraC family transcriptional regulator [Oscillospiraceae bacterium]